MANLKKLKKDLTRLEPEQLKDILEFLVDDEEEPKEEPQKEEKKEPEKKDEPETKVEVETKKEVDFEKLFKDLQEDFDKKLKVVVEEVQKTKEEQKDKFGVKAQPKEKKEGSEFEDLFLKLKSQHGQN